MPAHLVRRSSDGIHHENARSEITDSNDREKYGASPRRLSVLKLGSDTTCKHEEQHPENNEIDSLNPAAWTELQFTDKHSEWVIAGAKPTLEREYRHKECRSNHACPCGKLMPVHSRLLTPYKVQLPPSITRTSARIAQGSLGYPGRLGTVSITWACRNLDYRSARGWYWIASARWAGWMLSAAARSAIVRATLSTR